MQNKRRILGLLLLLPVAAVLVNAARAEYFRARDAGAQQAQSPQLAPLHLKANLTDKILYVEEDGKVIKTYTFADGKSAYPTPRGTFTVDKVVWNPAWIPPDSKWAKGKTAKEPGNREPTATTDRRLSADGGPTAD